MMLLLSRLYDLLPILVATAILSSCSHGGSTNADHRSQVYVDHTSLPAAKDLDEVAFDSKLHWVAFFTPNQSNLHTPRPNTGVVFVSTSKCLNDPRCQVTRIQSPATFVFAGFPQDDHRLLTIDLLGQVKFWRLEEISAGPVLAEISIEPAFAASLHIRGYFTTDDIKSAQREWLAIKRKTCSSVSEPKQCPQIISATVRSGKITNYVTSLADRIFLNFSGNFRQESDGNVLDAHWINPEAAYSKKFGNCKIAWLIMECEKYDIGQISPIFTRPIFDRESGELVGFFGGAHLHLLGQLKDSPYHEGSVSGGPSTAIKANAVFLRDEFPRLCAVEGGENVLPCHREVPGHPKNEWRLVNISGHKEGKENVWVMRLQSEIDAPKAVVVIFPGGPSIWPTEARENALVRAMHRRGVDVLFVVPLGSRVVDSRVRLGLQVGSVSRLKEHVAAVHKYLTEDVRYSSIPKVVSASSFGGIYLRLSLEAGYGWDGALGVAPLNFFRKAEDLSGRLSVWKQDTEFVEDQLEAQFEEELRDAYQSPSYNCAVESRTKGLFVFSRDDPSSTKEDWLPCLRNMSWKLVTVDKKHDQLVREFGILGEDVLETWLEEVVATSEAQRAVMQHSGR